METENEYLANYNAKDYPAILSTVDTAVMSLDGGELKVLMVKRANHPCKGLWGLPGGFLDVAKDDSLEAAAVRSIVGKTGVEPSHLEQVATVGNGHRDKRGWSISILFTALMPISSCRISSESVSDVGWFSLDEVKELQVAFDHLELIDKAFERQRQKALYSFLPAHGLTQPFTLSDLCQAHETLIGKRVQYKTFSRRVEASGVLKDSGQKTKGKGKPAALYFTTPELEHYRFERNLDSSK